MTSKAGNGDSQDVLCIIPARGNSKGIPGKNIKHLNGRPLIHYTIDVALKCPSVNRVIVSTDSEEIAGISEECGAKVPFRRPAELAQDDSPSIDAIRHGLDSMEKRGERYSCVVILEPTSPLRAVSDVESAIRLIRQPDVDTVVGVVDLDLDLTDVMLPVAGQFIQPFLTFEQPILRRQDGERLVKLNGCVYVVRRDVLVDPRTKAFNPDGQNNHLRTKYVLMPLDRSIEIDNMVQFRLAELFMKERDSGCERTD